MPPEEVPTFLQEYVDEARALEDSLVRINFYLRGSGLGDVYAMSPSQREQALKFIEENLKRSQETGAICY